jgi:hypothetical protein
MDPRRRIGLPDIGQHNTCDSTPCCGPEGAYDPTRLASIRRAAIELERVAFHSIDETGRCSCVPISWPNALASLAMGWLAAKRPTYAVAVLLPAILQVRDRDWCVIDRGAPEGVTRDRRPDNLACALLELLDDMDLLASALGFTAE